MLLGMPASADAGFRSRLGTALDAAMYYRDRDEHDIAVAIGVDRATVYRWLRGGTAMSAAHAAALVIALDAPSDLFLRPPETRGEALAMMGAWDELRRGGMPPGPSRP